MNRRETTLITGASSGLGVDFANLLAQQGNDLVLVARRETKLLSLAENLRKEYGISVHIYSEDLSDPSAPERIYSFVQEKKLIITTLINNAGTQVYGAFQTVELQKDLDLIAVNLTSLVTLTKLFAQDMVIRAQGYILNVGSTGSFAPGPHDAVYQATKAFVLSFSEGINADLKGSGVSVTALCPGAMSTEFSVKAEIENTPIFRYTAMASQRCARTGIAAMKKRKAVIVPGLFNKLLVSSLRFIPRGIVITLSGLLLQRMKS